MKNYTLEQYNKKYRNRREKILKVSKKEVEEFNKKNPSMPKDYLLRNKKWTLIGDTYYQIPRCPSFSWFRNLHMAFQIGAYVLLTGAAVTGVVLAEMQGANHPIDYITYTLDTDVKLKTLPDKVEIVENSSLPGTTLKHKAGYDNNDFRVMVFTDTHLDHNKVTCSYTFSMVARNIMEVEPDLVVFCGDNITSSYNEPRTKQFAQMLEDLNVYWCATLGNHEKNRTNPYCIEREHMVNIWRGYKHCLIDKKSKQKLNDGTEVWGVGNSLINLLGSNGEVTQSLYFLDSGTEMNADDMKEYAKEIQLYKDMGKAKQTEIDFYDYIKDSQVEWYKQTFSKVREYSSNTHSTIFSHVPLIEHGIGYLNLFNTWEKDEVMASQGYGSKLKIRAFTDYPQNSSEHDKYYAKDVPDLYNENNGYVKGKLNRRREDLCYGPHDLRYIDQNNPANPDKHTPIFDAMKINFGNNNAFFCGHDHQNNFTIKWDGQFLGYIQPACYSSNNLYTEGLLGKDPFNPEAGGLYDGHLIQGYTNLTYSSTTDKGVNNVLNKIENVDNYTYWKNKKPELYNRILLLVKIQLYTGKGRVYKDNHSSYLDGRYL